MRCVYKNVLRGRTSPIIYSKLYDHATQTHRHTDTHTHSITSKIVWKTCFFSSLFVNSATKSFLILSFCILVFFHFFYFRLSRCAARYIKNASNNLSTNEYNAWHKYLLLPPLPNWWAFPLVRLMWTDHSIAQNNTITLLHANVIYRFV